MPLLDQFLSSDSKMLRPRLIDYELLTDEKGKRTVGFGWYAGGITAVYLAWGSHTYKATLRFCAVYSRRGIRIIVCACTRFVRARHRESFPCKLLLYPSGTIYTISYADSRNIEHTETTYPTLFKDAVHRVTRACRRPHRIGGHSDFPRSGRYCCHRASTLSGTWHSSVSDALMFQIFPL